MSCQTLAHCYSLPLHLYHLNNVTANLFNPCPALVCIISRLCFGSFSPIHHSRLHVFALVMKLRNRNRIQRPARYQQVVVLSCLVDTQASNCQSSEPSRRCSSPLTCRHLLFVLFRVYPKISVTAFFSETESDDYTITITARYSEDGSDEISRPGLYSSCIKMPSKLKEDSQVLLVSQMFSLK